MMNESVTVPPPASPAATSFDLNLRFEGAFIFSLQTESNSSSPDAKITGVNVYAPICGHTNSATVNSDATYMLESYWHCIDPVYDPAHEPVPLTLGQLYKSIGANTPWTVGNRPISGEWDVAFRLPVPPEDWQCDYLVAGAQACFSGSDATIIPDSVALEHTLTYTQISSAKFHGACFQPSFTPVNGAVDLYLTSEVPFIPTKQHERRAADAMAQLIGLDLLWESSLGSVTVPSSGAFEPRTKTGNCIMAIVSGPVPA
jgi:hypothetical protein